MSLNENVNNLEDTSRRGESSQTKGFRVRPIKFRQKVNDNFHYWGWLASDCFTNPKSYKFPSDQYIGLKDSKGIEIYENDICLLDNTDIGGGRGIGQIVWCTDLTLYQTPCFTLVSDRGFVESLLGYLEVIGNHYNGRNRYDDL